MQELKQWIDTLWVSQDTRVLVGVAIAIGSISLVSLALLSKSGAAQPKKRKRKRKTTKPKPLTPIQQLDAIVAHVRTELAPGCEEFVNGILASLAAGVNCKTEENRYRYDFYNEKLLEQLMKLDGIEGDGDIRDKRKQSVKYVQSFHKLLDKIKKDV
ncbi:unnamed protein product [Kuraishia capsulata CBS 1993]|uniref:BAG domain-containing protein n=1 Tax=Kuraishia capsulata CBS 1993 TaxID=1382522 RepID=W6MLR2_9ASCO|nr:uncharacterized protein KUCA_T00003437001 [Kuraishia capsulata CBS 1993]CDK27459.1 unnamed protein product [Kuraishia capsulata CBS 1993]